MATIQYLSRSTVQASRPNEAVTARFELAPWEIQRLFISPIQKGLLFYKPNDDTNNIITRLKNSLSRTLDFFPPLAGRIATVEHEDDTSSFYVDCNNTGVLFVHALADGVRVSDIVESVNVPRIVHSFFLLNGRQNIEAISEPILAVQVTELVDGIFIGLTWNHSVGDGVSFWDFFKSWAEISCGSDNISKSLVYQRWLPEGIDFPIRIPNSQVKGIRTQFIPTPYQERVFHFTKESITKLKATANSEVGTEKVSSLQTILCHLWRSVSRVKHLDPNTETSFSITIGCRPRIQSLPEEYFGVAIQPATLTVKAKQLAEEHGLGKSAMEMNRMIDEYTEQKLIDNLESWSRRPSITAPSNVPRNSLKISSSPRFKVYENDFGWGKPIATRSGPANKCEGKVTVSCGVEEGSIDIEVCFSPEILEALGNDEKFVAA